MALQTITINSILGGWQTSDYFGRSDEFLGSVGIDPDMPVTDTAAKPSGLIRPTAMAKFSASEVTGVPLWFVTNPKTDKTYLYANDGKVHTVDDDLTMGTALNSGNALSSSSGNGAAYYGNYAYFAKNADVARYGPLNGSAALTQDYWTSTLSLTAPTDTTYPSINGVEMPNHQMHRHTDDKLYFCDVNTDNEGILSYVKTTKTTVEGDTNDVSTHNALDFDYGQYPVCIETYGTDLAVAVIEGTDTTASQKPASISFWDTTSASFYKITSVELYDPLITAIKNVNGALYVFSGFATGGCRVSVFAGGYSLQEIAYIPDIYPPISSGAVDHVLGRIAWGTTTATPEASGSVFSYGSKELSFPTGIHNILNTTGSTGAMATAVKYITQDGNILQPVVGWKDNSAKGLDKISTTYGDYNIWRSERFRIGNKFNVNGIRMPLAQAIAANMTLTVKLLSANGTASETVATINNTNNPGENYIEIYPTDTYDNDFYLQLEWSGTALCTVAMPITINLEIHDE